MTNHCAFTAGYIDALDFTNTSHPDSEVYGAELSPELRAEAEADCERFQIEAAPLLDLAYESGEYDSEQAGRDFWFTRCGHGVGFWDRAELDRRVRQALSALAATYGNRDVYLGDDGKAYTC